MNRHKLRLYFLSHLRVGYVSGLIAADALFAILLALDLLRLQMSGVSVTAALKLTAPRLLGPTLVPSLRLLLFLTLILPICIAVVRIIIGGGRFAPPFLGWRGHVVRTAHVGISVFLCASYSTISAAQTLAGLSFDGAKADYAFHSWYEAYFVSPVSWLLVPITVVAGLILAALPSLLPTDFRVAGWLRDYLTHVLLADLKSGLHPVNGRHSANFNTAAGAPELNVVRRTAERHLDAYRKRVAGSTESGNYLFQLAEQCRQLIQELLFGSLPATHRIEFYPGTSRALEIALTRMRSPKNIVLSPYEHPAEHSVACWHAAQTGSTLVRLQLSNEDFARDFDAHKRIVVQKISDAIATASHEPVLVLSEVCFSTGLVVPVRQLIEDVKNKVSGRSFQIIIDGAHAVGNAQRLLKPSLFDAYVFSAHKWLYSSEPMGVLISAKGSGTAYDGWGDQLPNTWASARTIACLLASLEMFRDHRVEFFQERSRILREEFESDSDIRDRFEIVGAACSKQMPSTNMISLQPTKDYRWNGQAPSLNAFFQIRKVYPLLLDHEALGTLALDGADPEPTKPWVRVSFPYFLDVREVRQLARALCGAVVKTER